MKNLRNFALGALAVASLIACNDDDDNPGIPDVPAQSEAQSILTAFAEDGGTPFDAATAVQFSSDYNVFIPSTYGLDLNLLSPSNPFGPVTRLPLYKGWDPNGNPVDYIITEASDREVATILGVVYAPRMAAAVGSNGVQNVQIVDGRLAFPGTVDFSPSRSVTPGDPNIAGSPNEATGSAFPPSAVSPGAVGDSEWSSFVVLPSGVVLNAQLMANSTGIHDRIPKIQEDNQNNVNLDRTNRAVVLQILDGWHDGGKYYYHLVTDASQQGPAAIEQGVYASKLNDLPTFGVFPDGSLLGFSPVGNGVAGEQGLDTTTLDQSIDPVNIFPIDPSNELFSPMWDAHINMWTEDAISQGLRRVITSTDDLRTLVDGGWVTSFVGNLQGPSNPFIAGLNPTGALINCPVIAQPNASVIGTTVGTPWNN
ncbi:hypothetical protein [Nonlabens xylanidelens]|nr:hypothetical protein [Nonlabens xylanidelens]PQJ13889.1 hypothetical protein BST94_14865 [Nonlabens xylanidelens]